MVPAHERSNLAALLASTQPRQQALCSWWRPLSAGSCLHCSHSTSLPRKRCAAGGHRQEERTAAHIAPTSPASAVQLVATAKESAEKVNELALARKAAIEKRKEAEEQRLLQAEEEEHAKRVQAGPPERGCRGGAAPC